MNSQVFGKRVKRFIAVVLVLSLIGVVPLYAAETEEPTLEGEVHKEEVENEEVVKADAEVVDIKEDIETPNEQSKTTNEESSVDKQPVKEAKEAVAEETPAMVMAPNPAGNMNYSLSFTTDENYINAGETIAYDLEFKATGAKTEVQDATIVVQLPAGTSLQDANALSKLNVFGVNPVYSMDDHTLTYAFASIAVGATGKTNIKVKTANGTTLNDTNLTAAATFKLGAYETSSSADTVVMASGKLKTNITCDYSTSSNVSYGTGYYSVKTVVPALTTSGDLNLAENSIIKIVVTLPQDPQACTYVASDDNGQYNTGARTITWEVPVKDMQGPGGELFYNETKFSVKYGKSSTYDAVKLAFSVEAEAAFIGGETKRSRSSYNSYIFADYNYDQNGSGQRMDVQTAKGAYDSSQTPVLYVGERLDTIWGINCAPMRMSDGLAKSLVATQRYDADRLRFEAFYTGKFEDVNADPYSRNPIYMNAIKVEAELTDGSIKSVTVPDGSWVYRADLGLTNADKVTAVSVKFENVEPFFLSGYDWTRAVYTVIGDIPQQETEYKFKNSFHMEAVKAEDYYSPSVVDWDWENETLHIEYPSFPPDGWVADYEDYYDFNAQFKVLPEPTDTDPTGKVNVSLNEANGNAVEQGEYTVNYELANLLSSTRKWGYIKAPITGAVLLPSGVTLVAGSESLDGIVKTIDNFVGDQQLVVLKFNTPYIALSKILRAEFKVNIASKGDFLQFKAYGLSGNPVLEVPVTTANLVGDSKLEQDIDDIDEDGDVQEQMIVSGRNYILNSTSGLRVKKTVKGSLDNGYSLFALTEAGQAIDYKITVSNQSQENLKNIKIMDVLPNVGDLGITDNTPRGSQWTAALSGPVQVPDGYQAYYSKAANPSRDDLTADVIYSSEEGKMKDPDDAIDPQWMTEAEVGGDWAAVHSILVKSDQGIMLEYGKSIDIGITVTTPENFTVADSNPIEVYDQALAYQEKVNSGKGTGWDPQEVLEDENVNIHEAWNSVAVQAGKLQVIEPMRAGVAVVQNQAVVDLTGTKTVKGTELVDKRFAFGVFDEAGNMVSQGVNDANGKIKFDALKYNSAGTYNYTVKETSPAATNWTMDTTIYRVTVTVAAASNNRLAAKVSYPDGDLAFENVYRAVKPEALAAYTINYLEKDTDKVLHKAKEAAGEVGTVITAKDEVITIDGYSYNSADVKKITLSENEEENVINLYYTKSTKVTPTVTPKATPTVTPKATTTRTRGVTRLSGAAKTGDSSMTWLYIMIGCLAILSIPVLMKKRKR